MKTSIILALVITLFSPLLWCSKEWIPDTSIKYSTTTQNARKCLTEQETVSIELTPVMGRTLQMECHVLTMSQEELSLEMMYDDMEMLAQLVQAEAGNQGLDGMRLVADVVLNRVDSDQFPDTMEEVIFQKGQFGPTVNGAFEKAGWNMSEDAYKAVEMEWNRATRWNTEILYFNTSWDNGTDPFKFGDHYFSR